MAIKTAVKNNRMAKAESNVAGEKNPVVYRTKTQALSARLQEMAGELGPDARLPTMQVLSEQLSVSMMTLNRALSELEAQGIIYRRQGSGTYVAPRAEARPLQQAIGLVYDRDIFNTSASPFSGLLVDRARARAASGDEKFSLYLAVPSREGLPVHDDLLQALEDKTVDGLLLVCEANSEAVRWLTAKDIPVVALSYLPIAPYRVMIDWAQVARLGVQSLAAQGCRDIGLWIPVGVGLGRKNGEQSFPELDAFRLALQDADLPYRADRVWRLDDLDENSEAMRDVSNQEQGYRAAFETFEQNMPDGLVILDDMMTRGALVTLEQKGVQVGKDLKIATHTNTGSTVLRGHEDNLTILEIDPGAIASAMFAMLEQLIAKERPVSPVKIAPQLKESSAKTR